MKITLAKPHALNGQLLAAGTHDLPDSSAQKLIAKGVAVEGEGKPARKPREEKAE